MMELIQRKISEYFELFRNLAILSLIVTGCCTSREAINGVENVLRTSHCTLLASTHHGSVHDKNDGINIDTFSTICLSCPTIRANPEKMRRMMSIPSYRRQFTNLKLTSHCTVLLISPGRLSSPATIGVPTQANSSINLAAAIFSSHWTDGLSYEKSYQTTVAPAALIFFYYQRYIHDKAKHYITLPVYMANTQVMAYVFKSPVVTMEDQNDYMILIGCPSCGKSPALHIEESLEKSNFKYYQAFITILPFRRVNGSDDLRFKLLTLTGADDARVNYQMHPVKNTLCADIMLLKDGGTGFVPIQECILGTFASSLNYSDRFLNNVVRPYIHYGMPPLAFSVGSPVIKNYFLSVFAEVESLQYSVILGKHETLTRDSLLVIFAEIADEWVWILLSLSYLSVTVALIGTAKAWFWAVEVFFEQGSSTTVYFRLYGRAKIIGLVWMLSTVIIRNLFSSSLTSAMTKPEAPKYIPETLQEAFEINDKLNALIIAGIGTRLEFFSDNAESLIRGEKTRWKGLTYNHLQTIRYVYIDNNLVPFGKRVLSWRPVSCSICKTRMGLISWKKTWCNTSLRVTILSAAISPDKTYNLHHILPFFEFHQGRRVIKRSSSETGSYPWLWSVTRKVLFLANFQKFLTRWNDFGILPRLAYNKELLREWSAVKQSDKTRPGRLVGNLLTYSEASLKNRIKSEDIFTAVQMKIEELINIPGFFLVLLALTLAVLQLECWFHLHQSENP